MDFDGFKVPVIQLSAMLEREEWQQMVQGRKANAQLAAALYASQQSILASIIEMQKSLGGPVDLERLVLASLLIGSEAGYRVGCAESEIADLERLLSK
jgi:hypothetical protein